MCNVNRKEVYEVELNGQKIFTTRPKMYGAILDGDLAIFIQKLAYDNDMSIRELMFDVVIEYNRKIEAGHLPKEHSSAVKQRKLSKLTNLISEARRRDPKTGNARDDVDPQPKRSEAWTIDAAAHGLGVDKKAIVAMLENRELLGDKSASTWTVFMPVNLDELPKRFRLIKAKKWAKQYLSGIG